MDTKERAGLAGRARAIKLSKLEKQAIGQKGAMKRWNTTLKYTHKGNFKDSFGIDVECFVLNDVMKTAVISQRGMSKSLGLSPRSDSIISLVNNKALSSTSKRRELVEKVNNPLIFQRKGATASSVAHGYDVTLLIDICQAALEAHAQGLLPEVRYANLIKQSQLIISASAKAGIKGLVYALSGYDPTRKEVIESFKLYIIEEAKEWAKEFPEELYEEWYRLYKISKPEKNRPWKFMHLTRDQIYKPLAASRGEVYELIVEKRGEDKQKRLHQFLSDIGSLALRRHIWRLLGIASISDTQEQYEEHLKRAFPLKQ